ncbi:MAG: PDZ domain-containing protein [Pirellulales bacterium]|nr:PDZ domain-containing protein [Pirellulales bacterium]
MRVSVREVCCAASAFVALAIFGQTGLAQPDGAKPTRAARTMTLKAAPLAQGSQPQVIQIHHHHYYAPWGSYSPSWGLATDYKWNKAYEFGFQPGMGNFYIPTKINWGNLGFFGAFDPNSAHDGLWVLRVLPRSPADRFGLAVGDFIVKINGEQIESYRQLRDALAKIPKKKGVSTFTVWDPEKQKNITLKANFGDGD